jgi:hypothetical protein
MLRPTLWTIFAALAVLPTAAALRATAATAAAARVDTGVVSSEFIFEQAPFPSCHASTIAQT